MYKYFIPFIGLFNCLKLISNEKLEKNGVLYIILVFFLICAEVLYAFGITLLIGNLITTNIISRIIGCIVIFIMAIVFDYKYKIGIFKK